MCHVMVRGVAMISIWGAQVERQRHENRGAEGAEGVGCEEGAVSYTHLTLPTNREV